MKKKRSSTLMKMELEKQGKGIPQVIKWLIICGCVASDFMTFYILFDQMFEQAEFLNWLVAGVSAMAINLFPMLISFFLNNRELTNFERGVTAVFGLAFMISLSIIFCIRLSSRDALFGMNSQLKRSVIVEAEQITYTTAQTTTAILMGLLPMLTSLICFGLTYKNPSREYVKYLRRQQVELKEKIANAESNIALLDQELQNQDLEGFDAERFDQAVRTIQLIQQYCQVVARRVLAEKLGTALAATALMEENSLKSLLSKNTFMDKNLN